MASDGGVAHALTTEPEAQRSSCEIKTSTRGLDYTIKVYAGSPVGAACDEAMHAYKRVFDDMEQWLLGHRKAA